MATEYLTNDTDLKAVADAIRTKAGSTAALSFPDGFVSAVNGIETGGGFGHKVTFPATATNWDKVDTAGLFQVVDGATVHTDMIPYSNVAGKTFDNVILLAVGSSIPDSVYYGVQFDVNGSIGYYNYGHVSSNMGFTIFTNTTTHPPFATNQYYFPWIPLSDIVITNLSTYNTD